MTKRYANKGYKKFVQSNLKKGQDEFKKQYEKEHATSISKENFFFRLSIPMTLHQKVFEKNDDNYDSKFKINDKAFENKNEKDLLKNLELFDHGKMYLNIFSHKRIPEGDKPRPSFSAFGLDFDSKMNQLKIYLDLCFNANLVRKIQNKMKFAEYLKKLGNFFLEQQFCSLFTKNGLIHKYKLCSDGMKIRENYKKKKAKVFEDRKIVLNQNYWANKKKSEKDKKENKIIFQENKREKEEVKISMKEKTVDVKKPLIVEVEKNEHDYKFLEKVKNGIKVLDLNFSHSNFEISKVDIQTKKR